MRLQGKLALVTGASRGIGAAIATAFAREGARVVIASRKQEALDQVASKINAERPGACIARACHMGDVKAIPELIGWIEKEVGVIDALVNNAGTNPHFGPLLTADWGMWDKTFEVNLKGYFEASRQVAQRLVSKGKKGSIVSVASITGMRASPMQGIYAMTKAGVISMTQTLAFELGSAGVRVNAIAPGLVETRLASAIVANPDLAKHFTDRASLHRFAQPEEIAPLCVFLASDESSYITGQTFAIDGGFTST